MQTYLLAKKKQVYKLIFHQQKIVYRINIKPKKAKLLSDIMVKNYANGI